ncbi:MAG: type II secretion system minor pseudopilin GspK [Rhodanobacteraceae bacterium]
MNGLANHRRQTGVALLVALLVVALATLLIAALLDDGQLSAARTRNQLRAMQAQAYARGLEAYAAQVLVKDKDQGAIDANDDIWAMPLPPTPVPGGSIRARMNDLNGCFNLNNLYQNGSKQDLWVQRFRRLLLVLQLSPDIAEATVDWISPDLGRSERGADDGTYLARTPAYLAANHMFVDASELRLVAGVDAHAWDRLRPYVCALPTKTTLNLNTASIPVLMSLHQGITRPLAARIHQDGHAHWGSPDKALAELRRAGVNLDPAQSKGLSVTSEYFRAHAFIELDTIQFVYTSLLQRQAGVRVLQRDQGGS